MFVSPPSLVPSAGANAARHRKSMVENKTLKTSPAPDQVMHDEGKWRRGATLESDAMKDAREKLAYLSGLDLGDLERSLQKLYQARTVIGSPPPTPATFRGRSGAWLVKFVQRALFWMWPQLDQLCAAIIGFADSQAALMEGLREILIDIDDELDALQKELNRLGSAPVVGEGGQDMQSDMLLRISRCQAGIKAVRLGYNLPGK